MKATNLRGRFSKILINYLARSLVAAGLVLAMTWQAQSQETNSFDVSNLRFLSGDDLAAFVRLLEETPTLSAESLPRSSAGFFSLQHPEWPPLPADIQNLPVWNLGSGRYLLSDLEIEYSTSLNGGIQMMGFDGPPFPGGGGGGTNSGYGGWTLSPQIFGTNDLWLEDIGISSNLVSSYLVIHPPWNETNGMWDLFATTNLVSWVPGLNQTNWAWLLRTALWQTNLIVTNFSTTDQSYFLLGTMLDSDSDGLTDAYENLVSHTDPNLSDTDGDGISDGDEVSLGLNPFINEQSQSGNWSSFIYDGAGQLQSISGKRTETVNADSQGNVSLNSQ